MNRRGFTLIEVLVATLVMAIAVVGLLSALSTSLNNASRLTERDRAVLLAHRKMDDLLLDLRLPRYMELEGRFDRALAGGLEAGWRARATPFEMAPGAGPGAPILERVELEIWWMAGERQKTFSLEAFRRSALAAADVAAAQAGAR